jgi:hypothetical protein
MHDTFWFGLALTLAIVLTGCGGGSTSPNIASKFVPTTDCNKTQSCIPDAGENTTVSIITTDNYIPLANTVTNHIDNISSARPGQPAGSSMVTHLVDLLVKIAQKTLSPGLTELCGSTPGALTLQTNSNSGQTSVGLAACPLGNNISVEGSLVVTHNTTANANDLNSSITISNLTYISANKKINFDSGTMTLTLVNSSDNTGQLQTITLKSGQSSLNISEDNILAGSDAFFAGPVNQLSDLILTIIVNQSTGEYTLKTVQATLFDNSVTNQPDISISNSSPLHWNQGDANPDMGGLRIASASGGLGLTLSALDASKMQILLDTEASSATTSW